eukprot:s9577_g1.t1
MDYPEPWAQAGIVHPLSSWQLASFGRNDQLNGIAGAFQSSGDWNTNELGCYALTTARSWNTNGIMLWAWMLRLALAAPVPGGRIDLGSHRDPCAVQALQE